MSTRREGASRKGKRDLTSEREGGERERKRRGQQEDKAGDLTCEFCLPQFEYEACELQLDFGYSSITITWIRMANAD